jgi:hypothetical protein
MALDPIARVRRPFEITEPDRCLVSARLDHLQKGAIEMNLKHEYVGDVGVSFDLEFAVKLRDVLDTLIDEQRNGHFYVTLQ